MPQFYCRGTLAYETMARDMTKLQREETGLMALKIINHPEMEKHVQKFYKTLRTTIKGDYQDTDACFADCLIAIERGVCMLLYHHHYTFHCGKCGSSTYKSKGKKKDQLIQSRKQKYDRCPNCHQTGDKTGESPIIATKGAKYYPGNSGHVIMNDENQVYKFFGKLITNNNLQQLRENTIKSEKRTVRMTNFADKNIMKELEKVLQRFKMTIKKSIVCGGTNGYEANSLEFEVNAVPSECVGQIMSLHKKALDNNVKFKITNHGVELARTQTTTTITTTVDEKISITMMLPSQGSKDAPNLLDTTASEFDHCSSIESNDSLTSVLERLPTDDCVDIFQIHTGHGKAYQEYLIWFGPEAKITQKNISIQLGISKQQFELCMAQIRAICTELGLDRIKQKKKSI